eukprot:9135763-Ditylum_brightwellii.AAC.1
MVLTYADALSLDLDYNKADEFMHCQVIDENTESIKPPRVTVNGNGKKIYMNLKGTLPGYGKIWSSDQAIANILSMAKVKNTCHVSYDSKIKDAFVVGKDEKTMRFRKSDRGLYYFNARKEGVSFAQTVEENKEMFFPRQVEGAEKAKCFLSM